jgi:phenylpropionate dioxygenase-like ring-hydroxylating dioxygenase large terminal subunit
MTLTGSEGFLRSPFVTSYLKNAWYVAAWSDEVVANAVLPRTLLETPVAMFRRRDGSPAAILDQCPHRFAPLSAGSIDGDTVVCGYHGLGFDGSGACTRNPHGPILKSMCVPAFRAYEAHRAIWIWMGEQEKADPALIPDLAYLGNAPETAFSKGHIVAKGNYEIFVDNIMDLSHTDYLHPTTLGGGAITRTKPEVAEDENYINVKWFAANTTPGPLLVKLFKDLPEQTDSWTEVRWFAPAVMRLVSGTVAAGGSEDAAMKNTNAHILTPETATSSHYFYAATRNYRVDDSGLNEMLAKTRDHIFGTEDKPMIELIQQRMGTRDFWDMKPLLFSIDTGPVRVRRKLKKRIEAESIASSGPGESA